MYLHACDYLDTERFDKVIAKIKLCRFFLPHSVEDSNFSGWLVEENKENKEK